MGKKFPLKSKWVRGGSMACLMLVCCLLGAFTSHKDHIVVCFGDSITHGAMVDGHSWVWYLQQEHHPGLNFINAGRSGRKTADRRELLPVLKQYPNADHYIIFLGVNDLKNGNDSMVAGCINNMRWMIGKIKAVNQDAQILLLAPSDINTRIMNEINKRKLYNEHTRRALVKLERGYEQLAREQGVHFLSLRKVVPRKDYADGLHPDAKGQQHIKAAVWRQLKKYL